MTHSGDWVPDALTADRPQESAPAADVWAPAPVQGASPAAEPPA